MDCRALILWHGIPVGKEWQQYAARVANIDKSSNVCNSWKQGVQEAQACIA